MMHGNGWYEKGNYMMGHYDGFGGWHFLIMLGVILIIVAIVLFVIRKNNHHDSPALNILKELYVKGDITEEEYLKRKNVIQK